MAPNTPQELKAVIKRQVNNILLNSTFAETINPLSRISEIITFPEDIALIKERIRNQFKLNISRNISDMTVTELYTVVFIFILNSKNKLNKTSDSTKIPEVPSVPTPVVKKTSGKGKQWNRRMIFSYILGNIKTACGRPVQSTEKISDLIRETQEFGFDSTKLTSKLKELERFFDIKIDIGMRIYNIGNAAEQSFIAQGKAPDSRIENESINPLWATIRAALSMNYWQSVILNDLNVKISTYKLTRIKSFAEFEQLVNEMREKRK
ncbi:MAG: hypothetical protein J5742_03345 [Alphaproteobacteria bacterium]|nr:hypothetical protein [Alphaproteobacteria bacterium]